ESFRYTWNRRALDTGKRQASDSVEVIVFSLSDRSVWLEQNSDRSLLRISVDRVRAGGRLSWTRSAVERSRHHRHTRWTAGEPALLRGRFRRLRHRPAALRGG